VWEWEKTLPKSCNQGHLPKGFQPKTLNARYTKSWYERKIEKHKINQLWSNPIIRLVNSLFGSSINAHHKANDVISHSFQIRLSWAHAQHCSATIYIANTTSYIIGVFESLNCYFIHIFGSKSIDNYKVMFNYQLWNEMKIIQLFKVKGNFGMKQKNRFWVSVD
jgi:hypothetical protein